MPGKKGNKRKSKSKKSSKSTKAAGVNTGTGGFFGGAEDYDIPPLAPREKLINLLTSHPVQERDIFGMRVSTKALEKLTPQEIKDLKVVFEAFDYRERGYIGSVDVRRAMKCLGFPVNKEQAKRMVNENGIQNKGLVNFSEFLNTIIDQQGDSRDVYDEILQGFKMFDYDGTGMISLENLRGACTEADVKFNEEELQDMILEADLNGDGLVDKDEFIKVMLQTNLF